ncbi:hypothetical protein HY771_02105 [Candidatus Uhrbacteria bacterium]|nr:hypothetical protein [Candidatus Uhrbacteria bacterium]
MLKNRFARFLLIAVHTFVAWVVLSFALHFFNSFSREVYISLHISLSIIIFAIVFRSYYQSHETDLPFFTTIHALTAFVFFEALYRNFFQIDASRFLNFVDWIFPFFLIASTIYAISSRKKTIVTL